MTAPCIIPAPRCGQVGPGTQLHHVLVIGADGKYVQPEILIPLCQPDCHQGGIHRLLTVAGIDGPMEATPGVLVGRLGETFRWLGWTRTGEITLPCQLLFEIGSELSRIGRDQRAAEAKAP
ncbi:MAG: hypothetical protein ACYDGN_16290 [Acidimicrobiales bacterium]